MYVYNMVAASHPTMVEHRATLMTALPSAYESHCHSLRLFFVAFVLLFVVVGIAFRGILDMTGLFALLLAGLLVAIFGVYFNVIHVWYNVLIFTVGIGSLSAVIGYRCILSPEGYNIIVSRGYVISKSMLESVEAFGKRLIVGYIVFSLTTL